MTDVDPRRAAFTLAAEGVDAGLPVPSFVQVSRDDDIGRATLLIQLAEDDREGVERWATWLSMPRPALSLHPLHSGDRWWQPFEAYGKHPDTGRTVWVKSHVTVPAPPEADEAEGAR